MHTLVLVTTDERDVDGMTPLLLACQCCDATVVKLLLEVGVSGSRMRASQF